MVKAKKGLAVCLQDGKEGNSDRKTWDILFLPKATLGERVSRVEWVVVPARREVEYYAHDKSYWGASRALEGHGPGSGRPTWLDPFSPS